MACFVQSPEAQTFRSVGTGEVTVGDGDWQERLEAIARKYQTRPGSETPKPHGATPRQRCAEECITETAEPVEVARDVHFHLHIHASETSSGRRSGGAIVRPLTARAMAAQAKPPRERSHSD